MLRTILLIFLLHLIIIAGITNALDEGRFLWAQKRSQNVTNDKGSGVKPGRWTRSVFNWLHSPLINSIQEAFVVDSIYENSPTATKCVKRSLIKNPSDVNLEESFENEFFLWEDNDGNPLEFGLKQIQGVRPCKQQMTNHRRFNRGQVDDLWEEPLVYEYNQDAKDVDINHLSYHEKFKLNDILQHKLHNPFHRFTFKKTTKPPSKFYTLQHLNVSSSTRKHVNGSIFNISSLQSEDCQSYKKNENEIPLPNTSIECEQDTSTEICCNIDCKFNEQKNHTHNVITYNDEGNFLTELTTLVSQYLQNFSTKDAGNYTSDNTNISRFNMNKINHSEEETSNLLNNNLNNNGPMQFDVQNNVSKEVMNHRNLRTVHHRRFLKYRRKKKRKNKLKSPDGHSNQYELFIGNFKSDGK